MQSADGRIWFATESGLVRFDGEEFSRAELHPPHSGQLSVRRLYASSDGALWLAMGRAELSLSARAQPHASALHDGSGQLIRIAPVRDRELPVGPVRPTVVAGLPTPWVWAFTEGRDGEMWIGTEAGLVLSRQGGLRIFSKADGLPSDFVTALAVGPDGAVWVATGDGVVVFREGRFIPTLIRGPARALKIDSSGRAWALVQDDLVAVYGAEMQSFPMKRASSLVIDRDDNVWVGLWDGGLRVFAGGREAPLDRNLRVENTRVVDLAVDREGSLWVLGGGGEIHHFNVPRVRNFGPEEGLPGTVAWAVLPSRDGAMWISSTAGISRYGDGSWQTWFLERDFEGWVVRGLAQGRDEAPNAGLWVAHSEGLLRSREDRFELHRSRDFAKGRVALSVIAARDGDLWVSWRDGTLSRYPAAQLSRSIEYTKNEGLCGGPLAHGFEAGDGSLWFVNAHEYSSSRGVTHVKDDRARCYDEADGLPDAHVRAITEDRDGVVWLGSPSGLVRFRDGRFTPIPLTVGLPTDGLSGIIDDGRGHLWLGSDLGVWRVPKPEIHRCADVGCEGIDAMVFGRDEGMRSALCTGAFHPNMAFDSDGQLWVATHAGVSVFSPPESGPRPVVKPLVEQVNIDGVSVPIARELRLAPGQKDLWVRYVGASYLGTGERLLMHRLRGFDSRWVPAGPKGVAHYHGLPAGQYTLDLRAGYHGPGVEALNLVVPPPFWRTGWFAAAMAACLTAVALTLHRIRLRGLQRRHRAITAERLRIARELHDGLAQKFTAVGLLLDRTLAAQPARADGLRQARQILGETHAELRRAIWDMRQGIEGQPRLEALLERVLAETVVPLDTRLSLQTGETSVPVSGVAAHEVPLVVKEAVTNAVRHAGAMHIDVGVLSDDDGISVWINDDGRGMTTTHSGGGYGIIGMHERARRLQGFLTIRSAPGTGTRVSLFVPRTREERHS